MTTIEQSASTNETLASHAVAKKENISRLIETFFQNVLENTGYVYGEDSNNADESNAIRSLLARRSLYDGNEFEKAVKDLASRLTVAELNRLLALYDKTYKDLDTYIELYTTRSPGEKLPLTSMLRQLFQVVNLLLF